MAGHRHRSITGNPLPGRSLVAASPTFVPAVAALIAALVLIAALAPSVTAQTETSLEGVVVLPGDQVALSPAAHRLQAFDPQAFTAQVLAEVNERREAVGESPLAPAAPLDSAAQAHAEYLAVNGEQWGVGAFDPHLELSDLPAFYATTVGERALKAGYPHDMLFEDVIRLQTPGSIVEGSPWSAEELVTGWIDAPLHRRAVLDRSLNEAGVGYDAGGIYHAYVLDTAQDHLAVSKSSGVQPYPANGQTGVPTSWDGNESPQPFPGLEYPSGYPITVFPVWGGSTFIDVHLDLERSADGAPIAVVMSTVRNVAFAPVEPLQPGTTYTATVSYTMRNTYTGAWQSGGLVWDFTTSGATPTTTSTTTSSPTTTTMPPTTSTTLPTTTTTTLPTLVFADVTANHPYRQAITAMAARGVIAGYLGAGTTRTFRPDEPVKRAQFAKMVVGAAGLSVAEGALVCPFPDVEKPSDNLYPDDYVAVAAAEGIVRGFAGGSFGPYQPMTRAQMISMVVRAASTEMPGRLDPTAAGFVGVLPAGDPTHGANIRAAESNRLLDGITLKSWDVWSPATRGEVAQILWNLVG